MHVLCCVSRPKGGSRRSFSSPSHALRQQLFRSVLEAQDRPSELDLTHTPSSQELLPQRLLSSIEQEKAHSNRSDPQPTVLYSPQRHSQID